MAGFGSLAYGSGEYGGFESLSIPEIDIGSTWKIGNNILISIGGTWKLVVQIDIAIGGVWKSLIQ